MYDAANVAYKDFQIDVNYPVVSAANATKGYWRDDVPNIPFTLPVTYGDTTVSCPNLNNMLYHGVMLGDINGTWNSANSASNMLKTAGAQAEMVFKLQASTTPNKYVVAVSMKNASATIGSFDFKLDYNESKLAAATLLSSNSSTSSPTIW